MERLGRYGILRELGKGSRGQVYLARDPVIERDVVLKTLRTELAGSPDEAQELLERFRREAKALGQLKHPSIVTIYDVGRDEETGVPYIAMEYVPGADLQSVTRSGMSLPVGQVADIGAQVAATLHFTHQRGFVHRDIKPSNLILGVDGLVRIADFGIVKFQGADITQTGLTLGTPSYMSPEQVRGGAIDGRSDLFGLGVVLYELLTGEKPFGAGPPEEVARRVLKDHPVAPTALRARVPRDLSSFVMRCLEKEPADRWATAGDLAGALTAVAQRERAEGDTAVRLAAIAEASTAAPTTDALLEGSLEEGPAGAAGAFAQDAPPFLPADAEVLVAERPLIPADPPPDERAPRALWAWNALLAVLAIAGLFIVVRLPRRGGAIFDVPTWVFGISEEELGAAPTASPTSTPPPTAAPDRREVEKRLQMARADIAERRFGDAIARLEGVLAIEPGHAEAERLLKSARAEVGR